MSSFSPRDLDFSLSEAEFNREICRKATGQTGEINTWGILYFEWWLAGGHAEIVEARNNPQRRRRRNKRYKTGDVRFVLDRAGADMADWLQLRRHHASRRDLIYEVLLEAIRDE